MDEETKKKLQDIDQEAKKEQDNELLNKILKDCQDFTSYQKEVEEQSEQERKLALEQIAAKAKQEEEDYQKQFQDIKNYVVTADNNPQQDD